MSTVAKLTNAERRERGGEGRERGGGGGTSSAIRIVHPSEFDKGTLQTPGSERLAAVAPQLAVEIDAVGRLVRGQAGRSHRNSPSRRAADHRIRFVGRVRSALGRERRIRRERGGRRFHPRAGIPAAHGNQSVGFATVPMGSGEKHIDSDRSQSSRGHLAIVPHEGGVLVDDMERPVLDPTADRNHTAHRDALLLRGGDLVPDPLAGDLALELGEVS